MLRISMQFFKRGGSSGMSGGGQYQQFSTWEEAEAFFGYGNGGVADEWMKGLSEKEIEAIIKYGSGSFYWDFNKELREGRFQWVYDENGNHVQQQIPLSKAKQKISKELTGALDRFELTKPIEVSRASMGAELNQFGINAFRHLGITSTPSDLVKEINGIKGKVFVDKAFTSTTAKAGDTSWQTSSNMIYHIKVPPGKGIGAYIGGVLGTDYHRKDVTEFLMNKGSAFKIGGARLVDGKVHVDLQYIGREKV